MSSEIPKIAGWKKKAVDELVELLEEYPIVGAVNMQYLPAKQLQDMRETLRDTAVIRMAKRRLVNLAIDRVQDKKEGIDKLRDYLTGMPALIFTKKNPFTLYKTVEKSKSTMAAKAGQIAPKDIVVQAGPTGFSPGPIIGELGAFKIKTAIEGGKVNVKEDVTVAKEGDEISEKLAGILSRLGIEPMEVGLDIRAMYEDGSILDSKVLAVDESAYKESIKQLATEAINLAVYAAYPTKETTRIILGKASRDAMGVATQAAVPNRDTAPRLIAKAERQMQSVKNKAQI